MIKPTLMMVKVLVSIIFALHIDNNIALAQDIGIPRTGHWSVFVGWRQSEKVHCQRLVCMETATTEMLDHSCDRERAEEGMEERTCVFQSVWRPFAKL
jgi:hypothetical protein